MSEHCPECGCFMEQIVEDLNYGTDLWWHCNWCGTAMGNPVDITDMGIPTDVRAG